MSIPETEIWQSSVDRWYLKISKGIIEDRKWQQPPSRRPNDIFHSFSRCVHRAPCQVLGLQEQ